ncbi:hypothetical protein CPB85DRAFT_1264059, partial [Mucidula mucida]
MPGNPTADHRKKAVLLPWKTTKAAYTFSQGAAENASEINDRKRNWFQNSVTSTVFLPSIAPQNVTTALQLGMDVEGTVRSDNSEWTSEGTKAHHFMFGASSSAVRAKTAPEPETESLGLSLESSKSPSGGQRVPVCMPSKGRLVESGKKYLETLFRLGDQPWRTNFDLWKAAAILAGSK